MVGLDDLASFFQLQIRDDPAARAVTATYRLQTIVLTPDQSLVSASGRLVSLSAPLTRRANRWLVPLDFISRGLAPIYDTKLDLRPASRLLVVGDLRVPRLTVRYDDTPAMLRVVFDTTPRTAATVTQEQNRLLVRFEADALDGALSPPPSPQSVLIGIGAGDPTTIQLDLGPRFSSFRTPAPISNAGGPLIIELVATPPDSVAANAPGGAPGAPAPGAPIAPDAPLPVFGPATRPTIRTIVLDPGHGGDDQGAKGAGGSLEKDVTLNIARRIKAAIEGRLGMRVLLTHEDDKPIGPDARAAIANNNKADLFISLHANSSPRPVTRGAIIFTLGLDRFGEDARRQSQADREVLQVFGGGVREISIVEWELAQAAHLDGSNAFAGILDRQLRTTGGLPSVSSQRASMRSLTGVNMPAVLVELGYLSNPDEEKLLSSTGFQTGIASAVTESIAEFRDHVEKAPPAPPTP
jgi:N-acetylmuramoyl-L-alanine amidase